MAMIFGMLFLVSPDALRVDAPAIKAASIVFPTSFLYAITFASVAASWTTLNAVTASTSRVLFSMGTTNVLPKQLTKLKGFWYYFWPIGSIVTSIFFIGVSFKDDFKVSLIALALIPFGMLLFSARKFYLNKTGNNDNSKEQEC